MEDPTISAPIPANPQTSEPADPSTLPTPPPQNPLHRPTGTPHNRPFEFGQRHLLSTSDPYAHNAWDHVQPDSAYESHTTTQLAYQRAHPVTAYDAARFNTQPAKWWDRFYREKAATFFRDRHWLGQEFKVLGEVCESGAGVKVVLEIGAGAGNSAFPIVRESKNPELRVVAVDFAKEAVQTMRRAEGYDGVQVRADVWDVTSSEGLPEGVEEGSVDVVLMVFIFSALAPAEWAAAVRNVFKALKPGGVVCFRDYGRGDLAQVRFKAGRWMQENFYVRGDGTRVYFFELDELRRIWSGGSLGDEEGEGEGEGEGEKATVEAESRADSNGPSSSGEDVRHANIESPSFEIENLVLDRRMIVNRSMKLKMHRCWIQGLFRKPGKTLE